MIGKAKLRTSDHTSINITAIESRTPPMHIYPSVECRPCSDIVYVVAIGNSGDVDTPSMFQYHDVLKIMTCCTWSEIHPEFANLIETYWQMKMTQDDNGNTRMYDIATPTKEPCKKAKHLILHLCSSSEHVCHTSFDPKNYVRFPLKAERVINIPFEIYSHEPDLGSLKWAITNLKEYAMITETIRKAGKADKSQPVTAEILPEEKRPNTFKYPTIKINFLGLIGVPSYVGTPLKVYDPEGASASSTSASVGLALGPSASGASVSGAAAAGSSASGASTPGGAASGPPASTVQGFYCRSQDESHMKFTRPGTSSNSPTVESVLLSLTKK